MRQNLAGLTTTHASNVQLPTKSRTGSCPIPASPSTIKSDPAAHTAPRTAIIRKFEGISWGASRLLHSWGLHGTVVKSSTKGESTDYDLGFKVHLPLAWLLGSYVLRGQLSIRKTCSVSNTLTLRHPSYFTVARVLDSSHPFFKACWFNDVAAVRSMLCNGEGRPTDVGAGGSTGLYVSRDYSVDPRFTMLTVI
jgi:hypothetical protein